MLWAVTASSASAQGTNWTNSSLGNWHVDSNWSSGVPQYWQNVFVPEGTALVPFGQSAISRTLSLGTGGRLDGSIIISNGGSYLNNGGSSIGTYSGANSAVTVNGANSLWQTDFLTVGGDNFSHNGGNGTLRVENGGWVRMDYGRIGFINGSNGSAIVTGANSLWSMVNLAVGGRGTAADGHNGTGTLQIASGGHVSTRRIQIYDTGFVQVNNGSSTVSGLTVFYGSDIGREAWGWNGVVSSPLGPLTVGNTASGRMVVQSSGTVFSSLGTIAANSGTIGSVLVEGAGSTWTNTDQLSVGHNGNGTLEIRNGGTVTSVRGFAGAGANSTGIITVSDPGSTWNASGSFFIGNSGAGSLQVLNGGVASTTGNSHLGITVGATGDVNVSGAGSTLNVAVLLNIGGDSAQAQGSGSVRIADGGTVNVGSATNLYTNGRLDLVNATTFTGDLNSFGGLIRTIGDTTLANPVHLNAGGIAVDNFTPGSNSTFSGNIDGPGGLIKAGISGFTGRGTLTLTGANTYTGATTVRAGTFLVDGSITSATTVSSGATLGGSGTIAADVTNNGVVNPGNSPGTLSITGSYTQNSGGRLKIELASPTDFDRLAVTGAVALGGTLEISLIDGYIPTADQTFDIFSGGSLTGAFSSVILPSQEGLTWDTSQLATGVIAVEVIGLPGDYSQNGVVDAADYTVWRDTLGSTTNLAADGNGSTTIDAGDYVVWKANFGHTAASGSLTNSSVPEPTTLLLLMFAAAGWCLRRVRSAGKCH